MSAHDGRPAIRVVPVGLGEMGKKLCLTLLGREGIEIVAACDSDPFIAGSDLGDVIGAGELGSVVQGRVCGFLQTTTGHVGQREVIRLTVEGPLCCDLPPFWVEVRVTGKPNVKLRLDLEHEDGWSTSTVVANVIPRVLNAPPGCISMKDLPLPGAILGDARDFLAQ